MQNLLNISFSMATVLTSV